MNPHQFHAEMGRLQFAEAEIAVKHYRHWDAPRRRLKPRAGRFHLSIGRFGRPVERHA